MLQNLDLDLSLGEEVEDISIYDFIPQTVSAFAQLLIHKENIRAFNELINCTEDQQNALLDQLNDNTKEQTIHNFANNPNDERRAVDKFSADECFKRIDSDLKTLMKKKRIPLVCLPISSRVYHGPRP